MGLFGCLQCYPRLCTCPQPGLWKTTGERKANKLAELGFESIGVVLLDPRSGKRATVDIYGRVQWWDVSGDGVMHAATDEKLED